MTSLTGLQLCYMYWVEVVTGTGDQKTCSGGFSLCPQSTLTFRSCSYSSISFRYPNILSLPTLTHEPVPDTLSKRSKQELKRSHKYFRVNVSSDWQQNRSQYITYDQRDNSTSSVEYGLLSLLACTQMNIHAPSWLGTEHIISATSH